MILPLRESFFVFVRIAKSFLSLLEREGGHIFLKKTHFILLPQRVMGPPRIRHRRL